ncbi:MAG: protein arginine kinase [Gallicola sp.]|nr:protein arginine kinase [Gallicola sp.]
MKDNIKDYEDIVISTRVRLARNIKDHRFPHLLQDEESKEIIEIFQNAMESVDPDKEFDFQRMSEVNSVGRRMLMEDHLVSPELNKNKEISAYFLHKDRKVNLLINEEDHLRLQVLNDDFTLRENLNRAREIEEQLEKKINFAFDDKYGYLTTCPTNAGTGLRASIMVHLPALREADYMEGLQDSLNKLGITVRGFYGEGSKASGDLYQISNQQTLGISEQMLVEKIENIAHRIVMNERNVRARTLEKHPVKIKDKVFRSLGVLKYARQIGEEEAFECLSNLRMGIDLGLYQGLGFKKMNEMMKKVQKYTVLNYKYDLKSYKEEDVIRADWIRDFIKKEEIFE